MDAAEMIGTLLAVREENGCSVVERIKNAYGENYDPIIMNDSKRDVTNLFNEG